MSECVCVCVLQQLACCVCVLANRCGLSLAVLVNHIPGLVERKSRLSFSFVPDPCFSLFLGSLQCVLT